MSPRHTSLASILVLLFICLETLNALSCSKTTSDGKTIDLTKADQTGGFQFTSPTDAKYSFHVNICNAAPNPSTSLCTIEGQGYQYSTDYSTCYPLGKKQEVTISFLDSKNEAAGLKLLYSGMADKDGKKRQLLIDMTCDESVSTTKLSFSGEANMGYVKSYNFVGSSKWACPQTSSGGGGDGGNTDVTTEGYGMGEYGVGGLVMTLALVAVVIYFVAGGALLKFKFQKSGREIIPNVGFWKDLPFLFIDGIMLPVDLIRDSRNRQSYGQV